MWKCKLDFSTIYKVVTIISNNKYVYDLINEYYSDLVVNMYSDNNNDIIKINTFETYSSFSGSEFESFETERGNELESLLHLMEELIFQRGGYNNICVPLHASAVVNRSGDAILIVGGSYSGKSTLLLYLITQGYTFYADDLILIERESTQLKYFPRPLHVREKTMEIFSDYFQKECTQKYRLSNDSYFVKLSQIEIETVKPKLMIEVKYNELDNRCIEKRGFDKIYCIAKNMKGTNISGWQNCIHTFEHVQYLNIKYTSFDYINKVIMGKMEKYHE